MTIIRGKGTLVFKNPTIKRVVQEDGKFYFYGESYAQFGFVHEWRVGPYNSEREGWEDFHNTFKST